MERVCKNALEIYIFSDFFHSPSNGKDPIWEVVPWLISYTISSKNKSEKFMISPIFEISWRIIF